MKDIENKDDIRLLVNQFYSKVQSDDLLSPVFALRIKGDEWDAHLSRMSDFWNTVLFFQKDYKGNPFAKHLKLPVSPDHFSRWVSLFIETIDTHFIGSKAEETKKRAESMALMFMSKLEHLSKRPDLEHM